MHQDPLIGRTIDGKYIIGPMIGQGAIGRVYRAKQISLEREVAIKILNPSYTHHPEAVARFRLEARAASRISHPGIVTILDWGKDGDGLLYLVIEYMPGRDLFDIAHREAPLEAPRIARLMQQVALALAHAHGEGIIHRDLKPENLRVVEDPLAPLFHRELVKIYDFGVAHVTRGLTRVFTKVGVMIGTPYYMSPEQAASADVFPQSDLYACGVIMFLLATGTLPFVGPSPLEVAAMHIKKRPPRPSKLNPLVDPRLEAIIMSCLAKDPSERPASGTELAGMLDSIAMSDQSPKLDASEVALLLAPARRARMAKTCALGVTSALLVFTALQWASGSASRSAALPACLPDKATARTSPSGSGLHSDSTRPAARL
ncbi:MAG TPA: serine/threonine-protein kinase [Polyangiaceae bacterium]|nr:serine/threonine-protein kinase [Polyangiaceae bacterium]